MKNYKLEKNLICGRQRISFPNIWAEYKQLFKDQNGKKYDNW